MIHESHLHSLTEISPKPIVKVLDGFTKIRVHKLQKIDVSFTICRLSSKRLGGGFPQRFSLIIFMRPLNSNINKSTRQFVWIYFSDTNRNKKIHLTLHEKFKLHRRLRFCRVLDLSQE